MNLWSANEIRIARKLKRKGYGIEIIAKNLKRSIHAVRYQILCGKF